MKPKRVTIVVKGWLDNVSREAIRRKVYCTRGNQVGNNSAVLWSDERYLPEISAWYANTPEIIAGYGYPDGTCLIYSVHDHVDVYRDAVQDAKWRVDVNH